jgi:hypothetical protein
MPTCSPPSSNTPPPSPTRKSPSPNQTSASLHLNKKSNLQYFICLIPSDKKERRHFSNPVPQPVNSPESRFRQDVHRRGIAFLHLQTGNLFFYQKK